MPVTGTILRADRWQTDLILRLVVDHGNMLGPEFVVLTPLGGQRSKQAFDMPSTTTDP